MSSASRNDPGTAQVVALPARPPRVFLLDASSAFEARLPRSYVAEHAGAARRSECIEIPPSRRRRGRVSLSTLEVALADDERDPEFVPLRVAWLPRLRDGERTARLSDLLRLGDPRDPGALRQRWIHARESDRFHVVEGEAARLSELRERWRSAGGSESASLADFVARQAALALERAERGLRGARYKVPRFVHEEVLRQPSFRAGLARLARSSGADAPGSGLTRKGARYLREIAATHSPFVIDLVAHVIRWMYTRGYGRLVYDPAEIARVAELSQRNPVVFLPTHKSNLDHLVLQYALHENGLPPNHTAGGINMNFFPVGPVVRRSGVFFIRRSFKDNELYKLVLRSYVDYLVGKRFPLEWYIEGGRSRAGKLLPPRFGMLAYVVDAYRRGRSDDVQLLPVSIAYDQIMDVGSYSHEQRGGAKTQEGFSWFLGVLRNLGRPYGDIHLRFGEALSLREALGPPEPHSAPAPDERSLALQKLAFEVSVRINRATPITPTSLVTLAMLGAGSRALGPGEVRTALLGLIDYVAQRSLPVTADLAPLREREGIVRILDTLVDRGVIARHDGGLESVFWIGEDQELEAAYYRNTIVHFFVTRGIAELALLHAANAKGSPNAAFWNEAMRLRDLLKFEFFFREKDAFRTELREELQLVDARWESRLDRGGSAIQDLVRAIDPFTAHRALRPFLESYRVVADRLASIPAEESVDEDAIVNECLGLGKQYRLQRRIHSADSISKVLFRTALQLAGNRGLLEPGAEALSERRRAFADEIGDALRRVETMAALGAARRIGWIP